jgi:four helix bundle protein
LKLNKIEMHKFKELTAWQKSRTLVKEIYDLTKSFPKEEMYGLTSQIRRATISIPTNIAEGAGRRTNPQFLNFLDYALGSTIELENLLILSNDLQFISEENLKKNETKWIEIQKMLYGLMSKLS